MNTTQSDPAFSKNYKNQLYSEMVKQSTARQVKHQQLVNTERFTSKIKTLINCPWIVEADVSSSCNNVLNRSTWPCMLDGCKIQQW